MFKNSFLILFFFFGFRDADDHPGWVKYIHLDGNTYYRHMSGRLLTPDDVTQPRIRECLERLLTLTASTLREQNLLADLPRDFEIVAERMDPEDPEVFYFVTQSLRRVINYAYDCPCVPNPTHPPEQCPSPKLSTLPCLFFSPVVISCALFLLGLEKTPGTRFWKHLASYPMHITALPPHSEAEFLKALTQGANGVFPLPLLGKIHCNLRMWTLYLFAERILDERKSMFPYTDQQAQRFMQVYRDLKCTFFPVRGRKRALFSDKTTDWTE